RCIRVFDDGGQFRIVNVQDVIDAAAVYTRVLHKFNITDEMEKYSIFTLSGETGDARSLSDDELLNICKSLDRPEKERLILRKKHQPVSHDILKRRGTTMKNGRGGLNNGPGELASPTANSFKESASGMQTFFGQRPPDEVIESNLAEYFPGHRKELLREVSNVRNSLLFRNSQYIGRNSLSSRNSLFLPRHSYLIEPGTADVLSQSLAHMSLQEADEAEESDATPVNTLVMTDKSSVHESQNREPEPADDQEQEEQEQEPEPKPTGKDMGAVADATASQHNDQSARHDDDNDAISDSESTLNNQQDSLIPGVIVSEHLNELPTASDLAAKRAAEARMSR
ncbi:ATP binding, partial [Modicella reniformis]